MTPQPTEQDLETARRACDEPVNATGMGPSLVERVALALAAEREKGMVWRPIDTAPKDGTPIVVARDMGEPWGWVRGTAYFVDVHGISGWIARGITDPPGELGLGAPTHWLPLPPPPARKPLPSQTWNKSRPTMTNESNAERAQAEYLKGLAPDHPYGSAIGQAFKEGYESALSAASAAPKTAGLPVESSAEVSRAQAERIAEAVKPEFATGDWREVEREAQDKYQLTRNAIAVAREKTIADLRSQLSDAKQKIERVTREFERETAELAQSKSAVVNLKFEIARLAAEVERIHGPAVAAAIRSRT